MKKLLFLSIVICTSAMAQTKMIYLNSKTVSCNTRGLKKECLQYKTAQTDTSWNVYSGTIQGFTYNPGYFYTLQVQPVKNDPPVWKLLKVISQTKSTVQQSGDSTAIVSRPPTALIGQWNFSRLVNDAGEINFTPEKEFLRFDPVEMKVTGKASCNSFFGNYTIDSTQGKSEIHFEAMGHTMMACEGTATENKMLKAMELVNTWAITGNKLYLKADNKTLIELTRVTGGKL